MNFLATSLLHHLLTWVTLGHHHIHVLRTVQNWMQQGNAGYAVLFGLLLSCGLGVPLPEDVPLLIAGYFVADGHMNLVVAAISAWCGIIGGDCILYGIGRKFGLKITEVPIIGSHVSQARIAYAHDLFEKYGIWVVAVGRLLAGIRGAMVVTAGTIRFTFWHFIVADGLAAVLSGGLFMGLGYYAHHKFGNLEQIRAEIESSTRLVTMSIIFIVALVLLWNWWKKKREHAKKMAVMREMI